MAKKHYGTLKHRPPLTFPRMKALIKAGEAYLSNTRRPLDPETDHYLRAGVDALKARFSK